jgi:hypothetical protein
MRSHPIRSANGKLRCADPKAFLYVSIITSILLAISYGCDYFPRISFLLANGADKVREGFYEYAITRRNVRLSIEGLYQPEYWGWVRTSWSWVGFRVEITNLGTDAIAVNPSAFLLRAVPRSYKAHAYGSEGRRGDGVRAVPLRRLVGGFRGVVPLGSLTLESNQRIAGGIEFPRIQIPVDQRSVLLQVTLVGVQTGEKVAFEIVWHIDE